MIMEVNQKGSNRLGIDNGCGHMTLVCGVKVTAIITGLYRNCSPVMRE